MEGSDYKEGPWNLSLVGRERRTYGQGNKMRQGTEKDGRFSKLYLLVGLKNCWSDT